MDEDSSYAEDSSMVESSPLEGNVFFFNDRPALTVQSDEICQQLFTHFQAALQTEETMLVSAHNQRSSLNVVALVQRVNDIAGKYQIIWCAPSGCAILVQKMDALSSFVTVIGLNGWECMVHSSVEVGREVTAKPNYAKPAIMELGFIPKANMKDLIKEWKNLMSGGIADPQTKPRKHKTPSFAWARLLDAAVSLGLVSSDGASAKAACFQGGTTDVGPHAGCLPRNTSFPLVASAFCTVLARDGDCKHDLFHKALVIYYLHCLR